MSDWPTERLGDVALLNPRETIPKGQEAPFIEMASVAENCGGVREVSRKVAAGGARFRAGDTLIARITPCLENGKIARVPQLGTPGAVGFGSTEFIVLRGDGARTDSTFLTYLAQWRPFRDHAEANLIGSSGRQRVSASILGEFTFALPSLTEQQRIAGVLGAFDDLIKTNRILQTRFMELFDASWHKMSHQMNETVPVGHIASLRKGLSYKGKHLVVDGVALINLANFAVNGSFNESGTKYYDGPIPTNRMVARGALIVANTDLTQKRDILARPVLAPFEACTSTHHTYQVHVPGGEDVQGWLYAALRTERTRRALIAASSGTTVAALPADVLLNAQIPWAPDEARAHWWAGATRLLDAHAALANERADLARHRDRLLPLLMSGKVRVSEVEGSLP